MSPTFTYINERNLPPSREEFARHGDTVSGTVSEIRGRDGLVLVSLHDASGRDVHIPRAAFRHLVDHLIIGDRFAFVLRIDSDNGKLHASNIAWLAPGQPAP